MTNKSKLKNLLSVLILGGFMPIVSAHAETQCETSTMQAFTKTPLSIYPFYCNLDEIEPLEFIRIFEDQLREKANASHTSGHVVDAKFVRLVSEACFIKKIQAVQQVLGDGLYLMEKTCGNDNFRILADKRSLANCGGAVLDLAFACD